MTGVLWLSLFALGIPLSYAATCKYTGSTSCWFFFRCSKTRYRYCVHGGWSEWTEQSRTECSVTCGDGSQTVTYARACNNPTPSGGGYYCSGLSIKDEIVVCNNDPCPIDGGWTEWAGWGDTAECTAKCGGGVKLQSRDRHCTNPVPLYGGEDCVGEDRQFQIAQCNTQNCTVNGGWSEWSAWNDTTECTATCGGGAKGQSRDRSCTNPQPQHGGRDCEGEANQSREVECNTQFCPVDGGWTDWEEWRDMTECTVTCGGGVKGQSRGRSCTNPLPRYGGRDCEGEASQTRVVQCNTHLCPVDGEWTDWGDWEDTSKCTALCGGGVKAQSHDRACTNPEPGNGGRYCEGESREYQITDCNTEECGEMCPTGEVTFLADEEGSHFYYICQEGLNSSRAILRECPSGMEWNLSSTTCVQEITTTTPLATSLPPPILIPSLSSDIAPNISHTSNLSSTPSLNLSFSPTPTFSLSPTPTFSLTFNTSITLTPTLNSTLNSTPTSNPNITVVPTPTP